MDRTAVHRIHIDARFGALHVQILQRKYRPTAHTHTKHLADKICAGRIYSNTMCTLYTSYSYNTLLASIWLNNQGKPCIDTNNIGDLCSKTHAKTVPDVKHKSRVLRKMTGRKTPGIQKNHETSAMLSQQKGSYPTRPKYLLFAAKLWNKFVDICCQHVQKGCGLLLPKLKANMWTICCQNARICGLLLSKLTTNMWTTCCQNVRKFADCCCKMERKCVDIRHFFRGH